MLLASAPSAMRTVTISSCTFTDNTVYFAPTTIGSGQGGAVHFYSTDLSYSTAIFTDCLFARNSIQV